MSNLDAARSMFIAAITVLFLSDPPFVSAQSVPAVYVIEQVTTGSSNHRAPSINNSGEIVWMEDAGQGWRIVSNARGALTSTSDGSAEYPSLAGDGSFVYFRRGACPLTGEIWRQPGGRIEFCSRSGTQHRDPLPAAGLSSDGQVIWGREFYGAGGLLSTRRFFVNGAQVSTGNIVYWNNPAINRHGEYVYDDGSFVLSSSRGALTAGVQPSLNDQGDVAYAVGAEVWVRLSGGETRPVANGGDPAISADGIVVFERVVNGVFQIFRATPQVAITVKGKCRGSNCGQAGPPLAGVTISMAGSNAVSEADGSFILTNIIMALGSDLTAAKVGHVTHTETIPAIPGSILITLPDFYMPPDTGQPIITSIRPKYDGKFVEKVDIENEYIANVNWAGRQPGFVRFFLNGQPLTDVPATSRQVKLTVNMASTFTGSLSPRANVISARAIDEFGMESEACDREVIVIPRLGFLASTFAEFNPSFFGDDPTISWEIQFPDKEIPSKALTNVPFLGRFGSEFAMGGGFEYSLASGEWQLHAGIERYGRWRKMPGRKPTRPKLYFGDKEIQITGEVKADGVVESQGILLQSAACKIGANFQVEIASFRLSDAFLGPAIGAAIDSLKTFGFDVNSLQRVVVYGKVDASLAVNGELQPPPIRFDDVALGLGFGLEAAYEPDLGVLKGSVILGGNVSGEWAMYPEVRWKEAAIQAYMEVSFTIYARKIVDLKVTVFNWEYKAGSSPMAPHRRLMLVPNFQSGEEPTPVRLVGFEHYPFHQLFASGAERVERASLLAGGNGLENLADITNATANLVQNVFPLAEPALAASSNGLMVVYIFDSGSTNNAQFTDIKWSRFDGTNWTVPALINNDPRAEFGPKVAFDGGGDAIAVWQMLSDPAFTNLDIVATAAKMEIVSSRWNKTNGTWSVPAALSANDYLDHDPLLCGPMINGDLLLVWTKNESNRFMGILGQAVSQSSQVIWSRWDALAKIWTEPQVLISEINYRLSQSLAGAGNRAVYAWTKDSDGVLASGADQEVLYIEWTNGAWGQVTQYPHAGVADKSVRAAVSASGNAYLIWQRGTNLVADENFSGTNRVVRQGSDSAGFADYAATIGPSGNLAIMWQEGSEDGSDAYYKIYDPASDSWSMDARLTKDSSLERSFSPAWDAVGNLTIAYNKVAMTLTNKTVTLENGNTLVVSNVPQSGRVDLAITKHSLKQDLTLAAGDFSVAESDFLAGRPLTLIATVRNAGDLAVSNTVVDFFDGNPTNGGSLIASVSLPGWLPGSTTISVTNQWVIPSPATEHTLYAVVDPGNAVAEASEVNNVQSLRIGGTDLAVSLQSKSVETNGAVRIIAQVKNLGGPGATNSVLAIRRYGQTNAPLAISDVPALAPGRLAQVALELPPGTQPEGEVLYQLFADETHITGDADTNNNVIAFSIGLLIDFDHDSMSDTWERANGLDPSNPADAQLDGDGDGVNSLAEYRAGTNPSDLNSYLRIASVSEAAGGVRLTWGSVSNRLYSVERSTDLSARFSTLIQQIPATPPENTFIDTSATNSLGYFYRLKLD